VNAQRLLGLLVCGVVGCSSSFGGGSTDQANAPIAVELCEEGVFHPAHGLSPARKVDYVALRTTVAFKGGGGPTDVIVDEEGESCKGAVDATCKQQVDGMLLGSGWPRLDGTLEYVLATVKDDVIVYPTTEALLTLLGPIDTAHEAALVAQSRQLRVDCSLHPHAYAVGDHFRVLVRRGTCVDAVNVQADGSLTIEENVLSESNCGTGIDAGVPFDEAGVSVDAETSEDASPPPEF
jgi:hypothetical protein